MKRIRQLDGVRGVAIVFVLIWHYYCCEIVPLPDSIRWDLYHLFILTQSGVDLFFVLSGFLIAGILLDHRGASNYFHVFYFRRICRIFPVYFLVVGLFFLLSTTSIFSARSFHWLFRDPMPFYSYLTFTQNNFMGWYGDFGGNWLSVTWSLAIEEQFYLFVPLLIYYLPRRVLVNVLIVAILGVPLLRCVSWGFHASVYTPWRADSLLSGVLLAVLVRWPSFVSFARQRRSLIRTLFTALLAGAAVMTYYPLYFGAFHYFWLAGLYSVLILIAFLDTEPLLRNVLGSSVLIWFGQLSYAIYMFHEPVSGLLYGLLRHDEPRIRNLSDAGVTLTALGITLVLAVLSYRFLEMPILRFGHRLKYLPKRQEETLIARHADTGPYDVSNSIS